MDFPKSNFHYPVCNISMISLAGLVLSSSYDFKSIKTKNEKLALINSHVSYSGLHFVWLTNWHAIYMMLTWTHLFNMFLNLDYSRIIQRFGKFSKIVLLIVNFLSFDLFQTHGVYVRKVTILVILRLGIIPKCYYKNSVLNVFVKMRQK